jgi:hypothetical protein
MALLAPMWCKRLTNGFSMVEKKHRSAVFLVFFG